MGIPITLGQTKNAERRFGAARQSPWEPTRKYGMREIFSHWSWNARTYSPLTLQQECFPSQDIEEFDECVPNFKFETDET